MVVLAGHGRSLDGTGHYLELAPGEPLTPADLLGASAPETLVLVACSGSGRTDHRSFRAADPGDDGSRRRLPTGCCHGGRAR